MKSLVESVRNGGVNQPALVRPREGGGYEIIAGHRRQMASQLAGYRNMPCIVRNMTDDEAILAMTDDNLRQRETILPSEKALSLKMQYEAIKHQGARGDSAEAGKLSLESVGQRNGMSVKTVQRYIWLNDLVPELKQTMDDGKLSFTPAVEISRVRPKHQKYIAVSIEGQQASPSKGQAKRLRELDKENKLSPDVIDGILCEEKKKEDRDVIITGAELEKFFWQGGHAPADERPDHDAAGGLERAAAARACQARQENGYGEVTTSGHYDQRGFAPPGGWLFVGCPPRRPPLLSPGGSGLSRGFAPPYAAALPLTACPGCAFSPASGGGISSRAAPFPRLEKGRGKRLTHYII